jgi:hypothetical protein
MCGHTLNESRYAWHSERQSTCRAATPSIDSLKVAAAYHSAKITEQPLFKAAQQWRDRLKHPFIRNVRLCHSSEVEIRLVLRRHPLCV